MNLTGIGQDGKRLGRDIAADLDIFRDGGGEEFDRLLDDGCDEQGTHFLFPFPAEAQNLFYQFPGPFGGNEHLLEILPVLALPRHGVHDHFRIADDRHENIIEVMGDAAGQGADGLHLLGVAEFLFQGFFFLSRSLFPADVLEGPIDLHAFPVLADRLAQGPAPSDIAFGCFELGFKLEGLILLDEFPHRRLDHGPVFGQIVVKVFFRTGNRLSLFNLDNVIGHLCPFCLAADQVHLPAADAGDFPHLVQQRFALVERLQRLSGGSDILDHGNMIVGPASLRPHGGNGEHDPDDASCLMHISFLQGEFADLAAGEALHVGMVLGQVIRMGDLPDGQFLHLLGRITDNIAILLIDLDEPAGG